MAASANLHNFTSAPTASHKSKQKSGKALLQQKMRKSTLWNCRELVSSWISKHVILYLKKLKKLSFEKERGIFEKASPFFASSYF